MKRVGIAFTKAQSTGRRNEYGIYRTEFGTLYAKYEGYREPRADGEAQVGLPLAGPNASWAQPAIDFHERDFEKVTFFTPEQLKMAGAG